MGVPSFPARHMGMESVYEYGSRAGLWRLLREFEGRGLPLTVFAVAVALARNPDAAAACLDLKHEVASHGLRWIKCVPVGVGRGPRGCREGWWGAVVCVCVCSVCVCVV
jgi:hypothetical protein